MVRATICINVKSDRTKLIMTRHIPVVATQDQIDQYRLELTNSLQVFAVVDEDIDQANSQVIKTMKDAAKKANPTCNQSLNKFSATTLSLMNRRNDLIIRNSEDLVEKRDLNKTIHKRQRTETRAYNQRIVETTIKEGKGYKTAKKRLAIGNRQIASLKNADGVIVTDREEILRIGERFYQTLYTSSLNIHPTYSFSEDEEDPIPDITRIEVESAIKTLKSGKSAGEDGISSTLIKKGGSLMATQLAQLFTNSGVWPKPQQYKENSKVLTVDPNHFKFSGNFEECPVVKTAVERYGGILFLTKRGSSAKIPSEMPAPPVSSELSLSTLKIELVNDEKNGGSKLCEEWPSEGMDEAYTLKIGLDDTNTGVLTSKSTWGALRGIETFSQLITLTTDATFEVKGVNITDFPRFQHRGFMVDTSRHFLSVKVILQNIQLMEHNKLNVFHWHIVDDQSFPFYSETFPQLSKMGAYNPKNLIYSPSDVAEVIEFSRIRGIRVIPEFDTPGHTESWGKSIKNLLTPCYDKSGKVSSYYAINPILNSTYTFLRSFFKEVVTVFKDSYLHLGGDELSFGCWESNPDLKKFMKEKNFTTYPELENFYEQQLIKIIKSLSNSKHYYIVWEEVFYNGVKLGPENIVHVWRGGFQKSLERTTKAGTQAQKDLVIGGEVCMWGEFVDGTNIISRTWPRASAPAERLWSAKDVTDANEANARLIPFRCLLMRRGFNIEPSSGPGFCQDDYLVV
ncbi:Beta-hexosaminidase subunit alpha [Nymphon striatum]|nr:Beta-hexosaminidase subunit alpha [Nymphon striatum]